MFSPWIRGTLLRQLLKHRPLPPQQLLQRTYSATASSPSQPPSQPDEPSPPTSPSLQTTNPSQLPPSQPSPSSTPSTLPPLTYPSSPSSPHHTTLSTFLSYAARTNLDRSSTVYIGTHFEYTAALALSRFGLALRRVGGASDCGIDLLGTWTLPLPPSAGRGPPLRVLAQCKALARRAGPHLVRELEGAFAGAPAGWRGGKGVVGLLVTEKPATKGVREALGRSGWAMGFVACSREGRIGQVLWNRRAEEEGLEGVGVGMRYSGEGEGEVMLTWGGRNLPLLDQVEEGEMGG
ncbi:hypothetical protein C8A05DRAFT_35730 [Staphylotrichum tortipilum]|uniref:Required for respiratory growth protein 7, mitochondrial n=1 Tax=Staphylotrichum tortipilum TaxID=2831512 RepID=A0AAN6RRS6_9PEZI|nr:hypothetical protein C8A05DRAFT_35730 [Staphylotrichum longicolle]